MSYEELLDSTAATRKTLQLQAAVNLTNISGDERAARGRAGKALLVVAAAAAAAAAALHLGPGARAAALGVPFWLGYSLIESSRQVGGCWGGRGASAHAMGGPPAVRGFA
jgi:hypothetical protein